MKTNGIGMWVKATLLCVGAILLGTHTSQAQKTPGIARVGWLEVCSPGLAARISMSSELTWQSKATLRGRT
jgi:hypothetical protein